MARAGKSNPSAWAERPADLTALGWTRDAALLFGRLQRAEPLGRDAADFVAARLDVSLPRTVGATGSRDGSTRFLLELADGARIEAVHMPRATTRPRVTVCLSSQVGCAMGCTFCADALERALDVVCDPAGLGIAPRRITVSTVGHVPGIDRLAAFPKRPRLAVSVNSASEAQRRSLMPVARAWSLDALRAAILRWPRDPHEKVTLEYVLLAGTNDDPASADRLADWAGSLDGDGPRRHVVNLIPWNPWPGAAYAEPAPAVVDAFAARLRSRAPRLLVHRRISRGRDVAAACGTLAATG